MKALDLLNCEIGTVTSRKDHSVRLSIETAELTAEQSGILMSYHGIAARVLVAPHAGGDMEIEEVETERGAIKTPSQRLRAVLFVWFQEQNPKDVSFNQFYENAMEKFINQVKEQLP